MICLWKLQILHCCHLTVSLPNHWNAVDAFDLNDSLLSVFHHHLYVPGECIKAWALCLQKAAQTLADTLESPAEGLLPRLRRALFWYAALPQLLLRDVRGKKKLRKANEISERCGSFLEGRYSQLLQSWRTDRTKVLSKSKRSERPDTDILRLEQAIKKIQRNEPHCISKAVNLVLGHGRIGCDNPETLEQMKSKHPEGRGDWPKFPTPVSKEEKSWHHFDAFPSIVKSSDPTKGVGPRGLHMHHLMVLDDAEIHISSSNSRPTPLATLQKLGEIIYAGRIPWVTAALTESLLTALRKKPTGHDARPVCAESADTSCWAKAASRSVVDSVRSHVSPQQLAVGVQGGMEVLVVGWQLTVEEAAASKRPFVLHGDDQVNAHNAFDRKKAVEDITQAANDSKASIDAPDKVADDLFSLAHMADVLLRVQKRVFARSRTIAEGFRLVAHSREGGAQGNPLTNLFYPMSTNTALKNVEALFAGSSSWDDLGTAPTLGDNAVAEDNILVDMGIDTSIDSDSSSDSFDSSIPAPPVQSFPLLARAFQDDAFIAGSPSQVYGVQGEHGARDILQMGLTTNRHATKACAYSPSPEDRALIPADVKQHYFESIDSVTGLTSRHYGIEIGGAAISADPMYRRLWLREKAADIVRKVRLVSRGFAVLDPQSGHAVNNYSLQALGEYIMKVHPASDTAEFASTVDDAMREAFNLCLGVDLLDANGHSGSPARDPSLTHDRALLRARAGGAFFSALEPPTPLPQLSLQLPSSDA